MKIIYNIVLRARAPARARIVWVTVRRGALGTGGFLDCATLRSK